MRSNVARGALLGIAGQAWHLLTVLLLYRFLAVRLGPSGFGEWRLALSVLIWFEIFINSGLVKVTTKAISETPVGRQKVVRAGYIAQALVAMLTFVALEVTAPLIARLLSSPDLSTLLRIAALDIPLYAAFMLAASVVLGEERFERQALAWIIYATAKFAAIIVLVAVGFSVPGALVGNALSSLVGFAAVFVPWGRDPADYSELWALSRTMLTASTPFLSVALLEGLGQSADLWMVSAILASSFLVGLYASAAALADIPTFLLQGLNRVIFPSVARADAEGEPELASHYAMQGVRLALLVTVLGVGVIAATATQALVFVYREAFLGATVPLVLLVVASVGKNVRATCSEVLMAQDRRRAAMAVMAGAVAVEVALVALLAPRYGIAGAAVGTAVAALAAGAIASLLIRHLLSPRILLTLLRSAVAAALVGAGLALWKPPPTLLLLVAYVVAAVVYVVVLRLLGEFSSDDIDSMRAAFARVR